MTEATELPRNGRGFRVFAERQRPESEWLFGQPGTVRVVESSIAGRGAHVWVFVDGQSAADAASVELNVAEALLVREALGDFITEARAGVLTEPARWEQS